jgi:quercetin 2,3-dioxygenase
MLIRRSNERGHANHGWLDSYHSFSFANYYDPNWMGFSVLRVINEDYVAPNKGFGTHGHRDMEIITYMISGELTHKDSMGNVETLRAGEVQRMTAGTGIQHSEYNASSSEPLHLLQIWIEPSELDLKPSYEDQLFTDAQKYNQWCLLASDESHEGALKVHQNMELFAAKISERKQLDYTLMNKRSAYLQVVQGVVLVNQHQLNAGDAALFVDGELIQVKAVESAELLLFDLPPA